MLEAARQPLTEAQLLSRLRPLAPRYYSIASSRKAIGDQAHLLVAAVRYEAHGRARSGVASVDVAERRKVGDRLKVFLKPNTHFRLPSDPERPVIMIGPGTGVAPFRGFMQERDAVGARGRNWLVFGHRNYTHDFLYQLEWQDLLKRGVLTRLDVAFSRDQPEKRYVQHALWDARRELHAWVQDGAAIYVCGDANAMAKDVHTTARNCKRLDRCGARGGTARCLLIPCHCEERSDEASSMRAPRWSGSASLAPRNDTDGRRRHERGSSSLPQRIDQGQQPLPARHHRRRPDARRDRLVVG